MTLFLHILYEWQNIYLSTLIKLSKEQLKTNSFPCSDTVRIKANTGCLSSISAIAEEAQFQLQHTAVTQPGPAVCSESLSHGYLPQKESGCQG